MEQAIDRIAKFWALAGGVILIAIMIVTSINVGAFTLDRIAQMAGANVRGLPGYEDFIRLAIAGAACMFLPLCQQRRGHVAVDLFVGWLPAKARSILDRTWLILTIILALFLAYWMILGLLETRDDNALSPILGWPEWPFFIPGVISLILWAMVAAVQAISRAPTDA